MTNTKAGQNKLSLLELNFVSMQEKQNTILDKIDDMARKIDYLSKTIEQFKLNNHDNARDIADMKLEVAKLQIANTAAGEKLEKFADNYSKVKAYIAGAVGVITVVVSVVVYVIDKFIIK